MKRHHARTFSHGRCNTHQQRIMLGHITQPLAKHLGERGFCNCGRRYQSNSGVKLAWAVIRHWIGLSQFIALTLFSDHM